MIVVILVMNPRTIKAIGVIAVPDKLPPVIWKFLQRKLREVMGSESEPADSANSVPRKEDIPLVFECEPCI